MPIFFSLKSFICSGSGVSEIEFFSLKAHLLYSADHCILTAFSVFVTLLLYPFLPLSLAILYSTSHCFQCF